MIIGAGLERSHVRDRGEDFVLLGSDCMSLLLGDKLVAHTVLLRDGLSLVSLSVGSREFWQIASQIMVRTVGVKFVELGLFALEVDLAVVGATEGLVDIHSVKRVVESASGSSHKFHDSLGLMRVVMSGRSVLSVRSMVRCMVRNTAVWEVRGVMWVVATLCHGDTEHRGEDS